MKKRNDVYLVNVLVLDVLETFSIDDYRKNVLRFFYVRRNLIYVWRDFAQISFEVVLSASLDAAESVNARLTRKSDRSDNEDKGLSGYIAPLYRKDSAQPLKDVKLGRSTGRPIVPDDIELQFQKTLVS